MDDAVIKIENLSKKYKTFENKPQIVLDSISLSIYKGQRIAIVGPNGSGKSTIMRIILGIADQDSGSVELLYDHSYRTVAYIPQDYRNSLFPWLRVKSNLALYLESSLKSKNPFNLDLSEEIKEKINAAFSELQIKLDLQKFPYQLSGGEQQILVMLQAILRDPLLFIADEPLSAIDIHKKEHIMMYLCRWLNKSKPTTMIVSHDIEDAIFLSDRIIVLSRNSGALRADISINKEHPRSLDWRYSEDFRSYIKQALEVFE